MADTRCDLTDLLADQCAHCRGDVEQTSAADLRIERTTTANYYGRCALDGRHPIEPGDLIGHSEAGWLCTACTAGAR